MSAPVPVVFIVLEGIVLLDLAGPAEALRVANKLVPGSFEVHYCAPTAALETGLPGLQLAGLQPLPDRLPANALVVLSGVVDRAYDLRAPATLAVLDWLRTRMPADGFELVTVCAGALVAAAAGLLRDRACTTHHSCVASLGALEPSARVLENRIFVQDGPIWTSAGITAGIDLALHLVARATDPRVASAVARDMVVYLRRAGDDPAISPWLDHRNHLHPGVHRVQDAVLRNPAGDWTATTLARQAHTSARHLARLFAEHAGCTPMDYLYRVRLALARTLLSQTRHGMERVAQQAGFSSAHHLRRVWRRYEATPPGALRAEHGPGLQYDGQAGPPHDTAAQGEDSPPASGARSGAGHASPPVRH